MPKYLTSPVKISLEGSQQSHLLQLKTNLNPEAAQASGKDTTQRGHSTRHAAPQYQVGVYASTDRTKIKGERGAIYEDFIISPTVGT